MPGLVLALAFAAAVATVARPPDEEGIDLTGDLLPPRLPPVRAALEDGRPHVLYVNFSDGTESIRQGSGDSGPDNISALGAVSPYPAFDWPGLADGSLSRDAIIRTLVVELQRAFLPYNIMLTTKRPTAAPYTMVMVGGHPGLLGFDPKVAGVALMDCTNRHESNVVFAFPSVLKGRLHSLFVTIAQEAAHSYGLEHTGSAMDIMYPKVDPKQTGFPDAEVEVVGDRLCGRETQNSHRRLLELVGAWPGGTKPLLDGTFVDTEPPSLAILEPSAGATVGPVFEVRLAATDTVGLERVEIDAGGERATLGRPPYEWRFSAFPPGPLTVTATAYDSSGNQKVEAVTIRITDIDTGGCAFAARRAKGAGWAFALAVLVAISAVVTCSCGRRRL